MSSSNEIAGALERHERFMEAWLARFEVVVNKLVDPTVGQRAILAQSAERDATSLIRLLMLDQEVLVVADMPKGGFKPKQIYNALTYLTRRGELARDGYGRYRRTPAKEARGGQ